MNRAFLSILVLAAACGKSGGGDGPNKWLDAKLVPTTVEHKGVKINVDIPEGLPENKESLVGPSWMKTMSAGPRINIGVTDKRFKTVDELARDVEPDEKRADLVEVKKEALPDGRLQYISAVKGGRHIDVALWIPIDDTRALDASCHWYAGPDAKDSATPDANMIAWLTKICDSVRVAK